VLPNRLNAKRFSQIRPTDPPRSDVTPHGGQASATQGYLVFHRLALHATTPHQPEFSPQLLPEPPNDPRNPTAISVNRLGSRQIAPGINQRLTEGLAGHEELGIEWQSGIGRMGLN
jgi:hypothetical protein